MLEKSRCIDVVETAKLIRRALKSTFPGVKFGVRSSRHTFASSVYIRWTDGPSREEVEQVAHRYEGATLGVHDDLLTRHEHILAHEDGSVERVRFGADYVQCFRFDSERDPWVPGDPLDSPKLLEAIRKRDAVVDDGEPPF